MIARVERGGAPARAPAISRRGGCWCGPRDPACSRLPLELSSTLHVALRRPPGEELGEVLEDDPPIAFLPGYRPAGDQDFRPGGPEEAGQEVGSSTRPASRTEPGMSSTSMSEL